MDYNTKPKTEWHYKLFFIILLVISFYAFVKEINFFDSKGPSNPPESLQSVIAKSLEGTTGTYAVAVKNLKTGQSFFLNEHKIFEAGSLYKLWVMAEAYKQIEAGNFSEDEILSEDVATLNNEFNIDPGTAELTKGAVTFSVRDALNQMITISHNYAAILLTEKIKLSSVSSFLKDNGFRESSVGINNEPPQSSASDILLFFEKLYKGEIETKENTQKMIETLKKQQLNDKLPKYLPEGTQVAHKTGEIDYFTHDAGIVFTKDGDYIIVVLSDSSSPEGAGDRIAGLSKAVYDYFTQALQPS